MSTCPVCGSPAATTEDFAPTQKGVHCPNCKDYTLSEGLLNDPELPRIGHLSQALQWRFFCGGPFHLPDIEVAKWIAGWFHAQDPADREAGAIEALVKVGDVEDPWLEPLHAVSKSLGLSPADSRSFVEDLASRGLVRIGQCPRGGGPKRENSGHRYRSQLRTRPIRSRHQPV